MSEYTYPESVMFTRIDRIRDPYVTGPCPNKQTLCARIARERNGDAVSDCILCNANHYMTDANQRHYPVPAIRTTDYVNLGYVSALNNFPLDAVWRLRQAMKS